MGHRQNWTFALPTFQLLTLGKPSLVGNQQAEVR
jgi:hypothetical protein